MQCPHCRRDVAVFSGGLKKEQGKLRCPYCSGEVRIGHNRGSNLLIGAAVLMIVTITTGSGTAGAVTGLLVSYFLGLSLVPPKT